MEDPGIVGLTKQNQGRVITRVVGGLDLSGFYVLYT